MSASRFGVAALIALACACGKAAPQQSPPSIGPRLHVLTVTVSGGGTVTSAPAGIDCGAICTAVFFEGTQVMLTASAGGFSGWDGACNGQASCTVVMSEDRAVVARFHPVTPSFTLSVKVSGNGSVTSSPAGIDCGTACSATFASGTRVQLAVRETAGWQFSGWNAECLPLPAQYGACVVEMTKDVSAAVTFSANAPPPPPPPPPPPDECAGLVPAAVAPVEVPMPRGPCISGTSDDGNGTFLIGAWVGDGPPYSEYRFFQMQNGKAVQVGSRVVHSDEIGVLMSSQPSGFTEMNISPNNAIWLDFWSHDGARTGTVSVTQSSAGNYPDRGAVGIDPSGGTAVFVSHRATIPKWEMAYKRYDKAGNLEIAGVGIDDVDQKTVMSAVVSLSGDVLVFAEDASMKGFARWLKRDGTPLTGWFFAGRRWDFDILTDGGLLARDGAYGATGMVGAYADGQTGEQRLPDWLESRRRNGLALVGEGKAYASWGTDGACGGSVEIVSAASHKSCGCAGVSSIPRSASVGRDGTMLVPLSGGATCTWRVYPQLLK